MTTPLERALRRPAVELDLLGGLYRNRIDFTYNTMIPHLQTNGSHLVGTIYTMIYYMDGLADACRDYISRARDIKNDYPTWFPDITIPTPPMRNVYGRIFAFTPSGFSVAGQNAWALDKFEAAPAKDDFRTHDDPNIEDNYRINLRIMTVDVMLYASRIKEKIVGVNTIRKNSVDPEREEAAEQVQAWLENIFKEICRLLEYLGEFEAGQESWLAGPLTVKEIRRIQRKYSWIRAANLTHTDVRPIDRDKVPLPDRPLLIRRTRTENINTM